MKSKSSACCSFEVVYISEVSQPRCSFKSTVVASLFYKLSSLSRSLISSVRWVSRVCSAPMSSAGVLCSNIFTLFNIFI